MKNKGAGTTRDTIDRDAKTNTWIQQLQLTCRALKMRIKITNVLRNRIWFWRYNISCSRFSRCQNWKMIWQIVKFHTTFKNRPRQITTNYFQNSKNKLRLYLRSRIWILNFRSITMLTHNIICGNFTNIYPWCRIMRVTLFTHNNQKN